MNPNQKIKPLLKRLMKVSNLDSYQDAFRKRYKGILHCKFENDKINTERNIQLRLFKVLKLTTRSAKSIDLLDFRLLEQYTRQDREDSITKLFSRAPNISIKSYHFWSPSDNFVEKRLKYLTGARHITYQLWQPLYPKNKTHQVPQQSKKFLRYLRFCPKIQSVILRLPQSEFEQLGSSFSDIKQHPSKLKYFSIEQEFSDLKKHCSKLGPFSWKAEFEAEELEYCFLIKFQKELRSIHFNFEKSEDYPKFTKNPLLEKISQLQEINLKFKKDVLPEVFPAFKKIAEKGRLKNLSLSFAENTTSFEQALEALSGLQLKHFSLKTDLQNEEQMIPIHKFIQSSGQLEYLELNLIKKEPSTKIYCLRPLCKEINKLEALRHLKLTFKITFLNATLLRFENIIPHLQNIFTKTIQLKTFHLMCNQMDAPSTLFSLMEVIKPETIHNLEISLNEEYSPNKLGQEEIVNFVQSLQNIRILKLYCFNLSQKQFLIDLSQAIQPLKYLRVFQLGRFGRGTITTPVFLAALEVILKKPGMECYSFPMTDDFRNTLSRFTKKAPLPDLKQILKANPSLKELFSISELFDDRELSLPRDWWSH